MKKRIKLSNQERKKKWTVEKEITTTLKLQLYAQALLKKKSK